MLIRDDRPRPHHYRFAHRLLSVVLLDPKVPIRGIAQTGVITRFLRHLWADFGRSLPDHERLPPDGLEGALETSGDKEVLLVTMPKAEHMAEAHFVAVTPCEPAAERAFFTLEHTWSLDDSAATVLGRWADGSHINLGPGPEPTAEAFLHTIGARFGN
jgi:hypothetical protein